ncbi:hypothetical protein GCM10016234_30380 [Tianweitania populi]|uniref:Uncharacterized protein n=1 Tax=Tianweitania populi TaxID=1607949 RepID=A0A8J3GLI1_9HYPH|nr:hypothetical protein GCM10016234_30380 [Tianweitania populi]
MRKLHTAAARALRDSGIIPHSNGTRGRQAGNGCEQNERNQAAKHVFKTSDVALISPCLW